MKYYKIILKQIPILAFAHTYESASFDCVLHQCKDFLEISFVEKGEITVREEGQIVYRCPEHTLSVDYNKRELHFNSEAPWHKHITVGLSVEYEMVPISEQDIIASSREKDGDENAQEMYCILPEESGLELLENSKIPSIIRAIIRDYPNISVSNRLSLTSKIMKLLSEITQECIRQSFMVEQITPGNVLCVQKAMQYISENIQRKVKGEEIAEAVQLSAGYLGSVFKAVTGQTLTEYMNRTKLQVVKELVLSGQMTFAQAGEYVGIGDTNYLSRLFRKYLDTTIQELKRERIS